MTVLNWLLDSDPAIRWHVWRDLVDAPAGDSSIFGLLDGMPYPCTVG